MACDYEKEIKKYLNGEKSEIESSILENHMIECEECSKLLENGLAESIDLPEERYEEDDKLLQKIKKRSRGIKRTVLFCIIGFVLGVFSSFYSRDSFIVTKAIMAIPYKISEWMMTAVTQEKQIQNYIYDGVLYFTHFPILYYISKIFTPGLIGAFIYGSIGYFAGDRKIFTLKNYIRFFAVSLAIISIWTGGLYAFYRYSVNETYKLNSIDEIWVVNKFSNGYQNFPSKAMDADAFNEMRKGIANKKYLSRMNYSSWSESINLVIINFGQTIPVKGDAEKKMIVLDNGDAYEVGDELFMGIEKIIGGKDNENKSE